MTSACRSSSHPLKRTLVVGGVASYVQTTLRPKLARWGFAVESHQEMRSKMTAHVGSGIDAVVIFAEMTPSRYVVDAWTDAAKAAQVPAIVLTRREAQWPRVMERLGFHPLNPVTADAVATSEEEQPTMKATAPVVAPVTPTSAEKRAPAANPFDAKLELLEVLISELKDEGLTSLTWTKEKGLDFDAVVRMRGHRAI